MKTSGMGRFNFVIDQYKASRFRDVCHNSNMSLSEWFELQIDNFLNSFDVDLNSLNEQIILSEINKLQREKSERDNMLMNKENQLKQIQELKEANKLKKLEEERKKKQKVKVEYYNTVKTEIKEVEKVINSKCEVDPKVNELHNRAATNPEKAK
jgi:predicted transcriptional regulator